MDRHAADVARQARIRARSHPDPRRDQASPRAARIRRSGRAFDHIAAPGAPGGFRDVRPEPHDEGPPRAAPENPPPGERPSRRVPYRRGRRARSRARPICRAASALAWRESGVHDSGPGALLPRRGRRGRRGRLAAHGRAGRRRRGRRRALRVRVRGNPFSLQRVVRPDPGSTLGRHRVPRLRDPLGDRGTQPHVRPTPGPRVLQVRPRRHGSVARADRGDPAVKTSRVAMVSVHACPLAKLGGRDSGGMNVYVRELARDLGKRGIEVDVFTRWREKDDPRIQQIGANARVIHIPSGPIGYWPKMAVYEHLDEFTSQLLEYVEREGRTYDMVHAHYWLSAKVARTLEQRWNVPVVQMFHTLGLVKREVIDEDVDGESDIRIVIEREAVKRSAAIVAASEIELDELRRLYRANSARVAVIPCGVDPTVFHPVRQVDAREALGRDQCERLILFVGRIEQIKGIDVLLRAMGLLFQLYPDLRSDVCLLVVGGALDPGDDEPETEKILELRRLVHEHRMESNVAFVGSRGQEELALYYAAADVCAVPSLTESFGLVALEAMACGTPVVGTRVGGLQTVIENGESGLLVPAGDYRALAEAIAQVLMDARLRMHLAHGARDRAEHFTWERVGDRVVELYDRVLAERGEKIAL